MKKLYLCILIITIIGLVGCKSKDESAPKEDYKAYYDVIGTNIGVVYYSEEPNHYLFNALHFKNKYYNEVLCTSELTDELKAAVVWDDVEYIYENNGIRWSDKEEELDCCTASPELFKLGGEYEDMLLIRSVDGNAYTYRIFQCLNEFGANVGKDAFKDKLHLDKAVSAKMLVISDLEDGQKEEKEEDVDLSSSEYKALIDAIFSAEIISPEGKVYSYDNRNDGGYPESEKVMIDNLTNVYNWNEYYDIFMSSNVRLFITDNLGIVRELDIHKDGYISYRTPEGNYFIVKVNGAVLGGTKL